MSKEQATMNTKVTDFKSILLKLASAERILGWSHGEVTKPETINYRTQRAERNGLFDERIFGPEKDYECYCGKYRKIRYRGIICEKCGVEVTRSIVRRERMGHIALATPVAHIWFVRGIPTRIGLMLDLTMADVERVVYFTGYIITKVSEDSRTEYVKNLETEYKTKIKMVETKEAKDELKGAYVQTKGELDDIRLYKVLNEADYYHLSLKYGDIFEVGIGAETLFQIFKNLNLDKMYEEVSVLYETASTAEKPKALKRMNLLRAMRHSGVRPEWMFMSVIPVIPPALRPMVALEGGRHATSDVNDLYRRVINRNNRLKKLIEIRAPEVICRNEKRILQEAVDALIDNSIRHGQNVATSQAQRRPLKSLADMLKGKHGRFRQNLLGKRVDYSGRSVIVVGPELKMNQCGLPKHMALELFKPFVISKLLKNELAYNIRGATRLMEDGIPEVWAILEEVIKNKFVLLNRAPTLHRMGIQAFQPLLIEGNAIQLHPLVCTAFNADFDGDQMAVHLPLSDEAQKEAKEIIASSNNLLRPGSGDPIVNPSREIIVGCFWMMKEKLGAKGEGRYFSSPNEAILGYDFRQVDIRAKIKVLKPSTEKYAKLEGDVLETTVGRLLFNTVFPDDFAYINEELNKKALESLVSRLIENYDIKIIPPLLDKMKEFGFRYSTRSGITWGMDDLQVPIEKPGIIALAKKEMSKLESNFEEGLITRHERYGKIIEIWQEAKNKIEALVPKALDPMGSVSEMVSSGARGTWAQVGQMAGMKGLMVNPSGRIIDFPVLASYKEGLSVLEYFITTHGARKGEADTALKTAKAGYLTRRLVNVADDVIVVEEDCGEKNGIVIQRDQVEMYGKKLSARLEGRTLAEDILHFKKGHLLTIHDAKEIEADKPLKFIRIFSPIACKSLRGVCAKCYGYDMAYKKKVNIGAAVGVVAAQAIGEPGTQLTLRTFHTGGIAGGGDITMGLPRVEEIFELRNIKNPAVICEFDGTVLEIDDKNREDRKITILLNDPTKEKKETLEYPIAYGRTIIVKKSEVVKKGDLLTDGSVEIKNYFAIAGKEKAEDYILNEIGKVYSMQGASINEKHLEVIIRKMFSRFRIRDEGETKFNKGDIADEMELREENEEARKNNRVEAKALQLVLPISKVSLYTSSFLSAASFQDTTRILIRTALSGGEDKLRGIRENVIIGRIIPAGTGFKKLAPVTTAKEEE